MNDSAVKNEISITDKAAAQILKIMDENSISGSHGIRIGVKGGGCSGFSYTLLFDEESNPTDTVIEEKGIKVFIDSKSLFFLSGTILDFSDGLAGKGFAFSNPNARKTCGCGDSFGV